MWQSVSELQNFAYLAGCRPNLTRLAAGVKSNKFWTEGFRETEVHYFVLKLRVVNPKRVKRFKNYEHLPNFTDETNCSENMFFAFKCWSLFKCSIKFTRWKLYWIVLCTPGTFIIKNSTELDEICSIFKMCICIYKMGFLSQLFLTASKSALLVKPLLFNFVCTILKYWFVVFKAIRRDFRFSWVHILQHFGVNNKSVN